MRIIAPHRAISQRRPLAMQVAQFGVETLTDYLAVSHQNSSDERIWTHPPASALGKLQRSAHMSPIRACELGIHATD